MLRHGTKVAFMLLCCVKTIKDVFAQFKKNLSELYHSKEIDALALLILSEITTSSKAIIKAFPETELSSTQIEQLENILAQLKTGEPVQYILGYTEFYGIKFLVNPSVLIPRPETEELVRWAADSLQLAPDAYVLDIGTGSGCIAISLKSNLPGAQVSAIDISPDALKTAKENARLNNVQINFIRADILDPKFEHSKFQIIISNPPYVTLDDKKQMHINVTDFEPHTALFVPENDPLLFYKAIADFAADNLAKNGLLFLEINESYGKETIALLKSKGFSNIELRKDMSDRDRMVKAALN
jgi:release factor glutamine methyltransferase